MRSKRPFFFIVSPTKLKICRTQRIYDLRLTLFSLNNHFSSSSSSIDIIYLRCLHACSFYCVCTIVLLSVRLNCTHTHIHAKYLQYKQKQQLIHRSIFYDCLLDRSEMYSIPFNFHVETYNANNDNDVGCACVVSGPKWHCPRRKIQKNIEKYRERERGKSAGKLHSTEQQERAADMNDVNANTT